MPVANPNRNNLEDQLNVLLMRASQRRPLEERRTFRAMLRESFAADVRREYHLLRYQGVTGRSRPGARLDLWTQATNNVLKRWQSEHAPQVRIEMPSALHERVEASDLLLDPPVGQAIAEGFAMLNGESSCELEAVE